MGAAPSPAIEIESGGARARRERGEIGRFTATTLCGVALNDALLWLAGQALLPLLGPTQLWANLTKGVAIAGTVLISYLSTRLWVFARRPRSWWRCSSRPSRSACR